MFIDIVMIALIAIMVMCYFKRGFVISLFNTASTIVSVIVIAVFHNPITEFVKSSAIGVSVYDSVHLWVNDLFAQGEIDELPKFFGTVAKKGIESANEVAIELADKILGVAVWVVTFFLLFVALKFVSKLFPKLLKSVVNIPFIKQVDKLLGGAFGAVVGFVWVVVIMYAVGLVSMVPAFAFVDEQLADSFILAILHNLRIV